MTSYATSTVNGITLTTGAGLVQAVPKGLIATRAVQLKDGWVGQVVVAEEVVKEKDGFDSGKDAEEWVSAHIVSALKRLLK